MDIVNWIEMHDFIESFLKSESDSLIQSIADDGLDINTLNKNGETIMSCAAECGDLETIEVLIAKGADGNVKNSNGSKPLHIAAQHGHKDIVKYFLNLGVSADSCDNNNRTPLHYVSAKRNIPVGAKENYLEIVHFLVDSNADLNIVCRAGDTPLLTAARNAQKDVVKLLIELGADVECRGKQWTVLHFACYRGWLDIVKSLAKRKCNLNSKSVAGNTPLMTATLSAQKEAFYLLIEFGADVQCRGQGGFTVLHYACKAGWLDEVKFLINKGCNIHVQDSAGNTTLHYAAHFSNHDVVEYLIESEVDAKYCDENGWTVLHYACKYRWFNVVKSLVKKGYDLDAKEYAHGYTPLHLAVQTRDLDIIEHLLKQGADYNVKNGSGKTAFNALISGPFCLDGIILFIENGADIQSDDYVTISEKPLLKQYILQNTQLCTQAALNKFNNVDLPKIYEIKVVSKCLPSIEKLKIPTNSNVARDIARSVDYEIETKGHYNGLNHSPVALSILSVESLVTY